MRVVEKIIVSLVLCAGMVVPGCDWGVRKRSYGYLKLGKVAELDAAGVFMPDKRLLLRRDQGGFFVMSTQCTYDLSPLRPVNVDGRTEFASEESTSRYDEWGRVLKGPARGSLPYYELALAPGEYGGPPDTLYAKIGTEVALNWRFRVVPAAPLPVEQASHTPG